MPRPYKGAQSYSIEQRHLFFGRDRDAVRLVALILSERLCVFHGSSGAGKTSLLQAQVMPALEDRGWITVRALPHSDPQASLEASTLFRVLPDPALEIEAIQRAAVAVAPHDDRAGKLTLRELRRVLEEQVPKRHAAYLNARRALPGTLQRADGSVLHSDEVMPFFTRFINANPRLGPTLLARQVDALARFAGHSPWTYRVPQELASQLATTTVDELKAFFATPQIRAAHQEQVRFLTDGTFTLAQFFDRLCGGWGSIFEEFGLVLVLDQFEELFTRFVDQRHRGSASDPMLPDWQLRPAYFAALSDLLPKDPRRAGAALPPHIVISMRDDHIADIDQLEQRIGPIQGQARYHLDLLSAADCEDVIRKPARTFNVDYEPAVVARILAALPTERDKIEPAHIQFVCDRLYDQLGPLAGEDRTGEGPALITIGDLERIGDVAGILARRFDDFLARFDAMDQLEVLDLLEPLMTVSGKRNIVEEFQLLYEPFRRPEARTTLLRALTDAHIVRVEYRLGGRFVEITHEFLIASVQASIEQAQETNPEWRDLSLALSRLERIERAGFRGESTEQLEGRDYAALWWYREHLNTSAPAVGHRANARSDTVVAKDTRWLPELLLRAAVLLGRPQPEIDHWAVLLDRAPPVVEGGALYPCYGASRRYRPESPPSAVADGSAAVTGRWAEIAAAKGAWLTTYDVNPVAASAPAVFSDYFVVVGEQGVHEGAVPPGTLVRGSSWDRDGRPSFEIVYGWSRGGLRTQNIESAALAHLGAEFKPGWLQLPVLGSRYAEHYEFGSWRTDFVQTVCEEVPLDGCGEDGLAAQ